MKVSTERNNAEQYIIEASKQGKRIWIFYLGFLAYSTLTIVGVSDRQIVLNDAVRLPIFNSGVSLTGYLIATPLVAIMLFVYFHLQLNMVSEAVREYESKYGRSATRLYPWIVLAARRPEFGFLMSLRRLYVSIGLWWALPLILVVFALQIIRKHDPFWSYVLSGLPIVGVILVVYFQEKYNPIKRRTRSNKIKSLSFLVMALILYSVVAFLLIHWAGMGERFGGLRDQGGLRTSFGSILVADLRREVLVSEPKQDYEGVYWADLRGIHLEGADLNGAVLKRADLGRAHLQRAKMFGANLTGANVAYAWLMSARLDRASLEQANLAGALLAGANLEDSLPKQSNLQGASFLSANLQRADLYNSNLQGAQLTQAKLSQASFRNANLRRVLASRADFEGANLKGAYLDEADLRDARNLTIEQLSKCKTLYGAKLDPSIKANLEAMHPQLFQKPNEAERTGVKFRTVFPGWTGAPDWPRFE